MLKAQIRIEKSPLLNTWNWLYGSTHFSLHSPISHSSTTVRCMWFFSTKCHFYTSMCLYAFLGVFRYYRIFSVASDDLEPTDKSTGWQNKHSVCIADCAYETKFIIRAISFALSLFLDSKIDCIRCIATVQSKNSQNAWLYAFTFHHWSLCKNYLIPLLHWAQSLACSDKANERTHGGKEIVSFAHESW